MTIFDVTLSRAWSTTMRVEAADAESAARTVMSASYPLPPDEQWTAHKEWQVSVYTTAGDLAHEEG